MFAMQFGADWMPDALVILHLSFIQELYLLVYLTGTVHINKQFCKCARVSQEAIFHLLSLDRCFKSP